MAVPTIPSHHIPEDPLAKKKQQRPVQMHVEFRPGAGEVIKPDKARIDLWALVETRTGLVLRWAPERHNLDREIAQGVRYY